MVTAFRVVATLTLASLTGAHPLHTTFTEVVEDVGGRSVTVTVRTFTDDLTHAVAGQAQASGTPVPAPGDSAVARYVRSRFSLTDRSGRSLELKYVGQRQSADLSWLTFTAPAPSGLSGLRIDNRLQAELYPDQVNLVQARYGGRSETLLFSPGDGGRTLP